MSDWPLRAALQETLIGLIPAIPMQFGFESFLAKETSASHLHWMARRALANYHVWPVDKTSRWIGFIQGVLATHGNLNVGAERDRTRPIFHRAYTEMGLPVPETA